MTLLTLEKLQNLSDPANNTTINQICHFAYTMNTYGSNKTMVGPLNHQSSISVCYVTYS